MFVRLTIIYIAAVVNLFENQENNRMRFITEPYVMVMLGVVID